MGSLRTVFCSILCFAVVVLYTLYILTKNTSGGRDAERGLDYLDNDYTTELLHGNPSIGSGQNAEGRHSNNRSTPVLTHQPVSVMSASLVNGLSNTVQNLSKVAIDLGPSKNIHHIYSAYYDARSLLHRPAVMMLGYVRKKSPYNLYCKLRYEDNSTECMKENVVQTPLIAPNVRPEAYFCKIKSGNRIPTHIMISSSSNCDTGKWSSPIPVQNRKKTTPAQEVGVCMMGSMWTDDGNDERMFRLVLEFLAMVKTLGGSTVTMYSINIQQATLEKILWLYPGFVEILNWENLNGTLHYFGQRVLINDCIYRNMYRVKYLAMIDVDEMIYPVSTGSWPDMLKVLEKQGKYASYTFSNHFMEEASLPTTWNIQNCSHLMSAMYFARLKRLPWPAFKKKTKMKMILKPNLVSATCIHDICHGTAGGYLKTYWVPDKVGYMAHYRTPVQKWYVYGEGVVDRTALKFQDKVMQEFRHSCSKLEQYP